MGLVLDVAPQSAKSCRLPHGQLRPSNCIAPSQTNMPAKKQARSVTASRKAPAAQGRRAIRLVDLLPDADVRGGMRKTLVFGQVAGERAPKK